MDPEKLNQLRQSIWAEHDGSASLGTSPRMLDIRTLAGRWMALPYEALRRVEFHPAEKPPLVIYFSSHVLEIDGRNLQALYRAVVTKKLDQLREINERHDVGDQDEAVVYSLLIRQKTLGPGDPKGRSTRRRRTTPKPDDPSLDL